MPGFGAVGTFAVSTIPDPVACTRAVNNRRRRLLYRLADLFDDDPIVRQDLSFRRREVQFYYTSGKVVERTVTHAGTLTRTVAHDGDIELTVTHASTVEADV